MRSRKTSVSPLLVMVFVLVCLFGGTVPGVVNKVRAEGTGSVDKVYTDKARYNPGNNVTITAQLTNRSGSNWSGNAALTISHLDTHIYTTTKAVSVPAGQTVKITFEWTAPPIDFQGYFVKVDCGTFGYGTTAIDVSSDFAKYPRYGYLSVFSRTETSEQSAAKVNQLAQDYHLNALQYYDWMWRHDTLFQRTGGTVNATWQDLFNRTISWQTIQNLISATHNQNMVAMAYAMVYAARENYSNFGISPTWGLYQDASHASQLNVDFGNGSTYLWMFDPANVSWQFYIQQQYIDAVNTAGFDGIHVDQMGERDNVYTFGGSPVDLSTRFSPFLNAAKTTLTNNNPAKNRLTFNIVDGTVNGWAANDVSTNANTDFNYSEIWYKSNSYLQLKNYIDSLRANSGNKAVVLAAYMDYGENIGPRYEAESASRTNVGVNTNHPGYSGTGFVDQFDSVGDAVTFSITAPEQGHYSLVFAYGNNTGNMATRNIYVDGSLVQSIGFYNQPDWNTWAHDAWLQVSLTAGAHTVKVAYDSGNIGAINLDSLTLGTFEDASVRLADAVMAASGATHIELGDDNQMLAHEYYPNRSKSMRSSLINAMKNHYTFITAYENLLFDGDVLNSDSGNQFAQIAGETVSGDGTGNTIWTIDKRTPDYDIIHLINLKGNDDQWRNSAVQPPTLSNLATKIYIGSNESVSRVYVASPDIGGGQTNELSFTTGSDSNGNYVSFTVPLLQYWDMIYMKRTFTAPANNQYEAEAAIRTGVTVNTNHEGYSGTGFVDGFANSGKGVSFVVQAAMDDDYSLRFRYANGGSMATRDVFLDGVYAGTVQFPATANWDTWNDGELTVHMKPGLHTIVIWDNASNTGAINLDRLNVDKTYIWQFDRKITSVPAGYRITVRNGEFGWIHWGVNNWQNVTDTPMYSNGSSDVNHRYETSIGPFTTGTTVNFTYLWDDNGNGIMETGTDRWEGTDFSISVN
ncbi:MAG TPA: glycoside hydrolase family 66 protein [Bacilli bacterium]